MDELNQNPIQPVDPEKHHLSPKVWIPAIAAIVIVAGYLVYASQASQWPFGAAGPQATSPQPSPSPGEGDLADWQTYRNEEFGFEVRYPNNFELNTEIDNSLSGFNCLAVDLFSNSVDELRFGVFINCAGRGLQGVEVTDEVIDGRKAARYFWEYQEEDYKDILVVYLKEDYSLNFSGRVYNSQDEKLYNQILSTFRFID